VGGGAGVGCGHPRDARAAKIFAFSCSESQVETAFYRKFSKFFKAKTSEISSIIYIFDL
jgi:hypothetical protein